MSLVICDGFGDGFYPDRWAAEGREGRRRISGGWSGASRFRQTDDVGLKDTMNLVGRIREELGAVIVLSVQGLRVGLVGGQLVMWANSAQPSPSGLFFTPHLGYPFPAPFSPDPLANELVSDSSQALNIQITLQGRVKPLQFPVDTLLGDVLRVKSEADEESSAVYEGAVRIPGGEGYGGTQAGEKFTFRIGSAGLESHAEST